MVPVYHADPTVNWAWVFSSSSVNHRGPPRDHRHLGHFLMQITCTFRDCWSPVWHISFLFDGVVLLCMTTLDLVSQTTRPSSQWEFRPTCSFGGSWSSLQSLWEPNNKPKAVFQKESSYPQRVPNFTPKPSESVLWFTFSGLSKAPNNISICCWLWAPRDLLDHMVQMAEQLAWQSGLGAEPYLILSCLELHSKLKAS